MPGKELEGAFWGAGNVCKSPRVVVVIQGYVYLIHHTAHSCEHFTL